ncbi:Hypothetical_protein [Hexamita inflata]|uniref:Hypothetical_protein n=2 Tax=Hexamita inflata TaxID=28002 RepID=A0AA86QBJ8_9EUKA|nr:Hypothetical protein HINF_LOCUS37726 [Hexamita inflata]CAI9956026.1 Hypothetical protein HINF_LOCUS43671 [Hexamita inflata]
MSYVQSHYNQQNYIFSLEDGEITKKDLQQPQNTMPQADVKQIKDCISAPSPSDQVSKLIDQYLKPFQVIYDNIAAFQQSIDYTQAPVFAQALFDYLKANSNLTLTKNMNQIFTFTADSVENAFQNELTRKQSQAFYVGSGPFSIIGFNNNQFIRFDPVKEEGQILVFKQKDESLLGYVLKYEMNLQEQSDKYYEFYQKVQEFAKTNNQFQHGGKLMGQLSAEYPVIYIYKKLSELLSKLIQIKQVVEIQQYIKTKQNQLEQLLIEPQQNIWTVIFKMHQYAVNFNDYEGASQLSSTQKLGDLLTLIEEKYIANTPEPIFNTQTQIHDKIFNILLQKHIEQLFTTKISNFSNPIIKQGENVVTHTYNMKINNEKTKFIKIFINSQHSKTKQIEPTFFENIDQFNDEVEDISQKYELQFDQSEYKFSTDDKQKSDETKQQFETIMDYIDYQTNITPIVMIQCSVYDATSPFTEGSCFGSYFGKLDCFCLYADSYKVVIMFVNQLLLNEPFFHQQIKFSPSIYVKSTNSTLNKLEISEILNFNSSEQFPFQNALTEGTYQDVQFICSSNLLPPQDLIVLDAPKNMDSEQIQLQFNNLSPFAKYIGFVLSSSDDIQQLEQILPLQQKITVKQNKNSSVVLVKNCIKYILDSQQDIQNLNSFITQFSEQQQTEEDYDGQDMSVTITKSGITPKYTNYQIQKKNTVEMHIKGKAILNIVQDYLKQNNRSMVLGRSEIGVSENQALALSYLYQLALAKEANNDYVIAQMKLLLISMV